MNGDRKNDALKPAAGSGERERTWFEKNGGIVFGGLVVLVVALMIIVKRACA